MDTLVSDDNWGAWHHHIFLSITTLIADMLFEQFLIRTAVKGKGSFTDKDFTEIVAIEQGFPQAVNLLCQFHMLKYIQTKIPSYSSDQNVKEQLMKFSKQTVYAYSDKQLNKSLESIEKLSINIW